MELTSPPIQYVAREFRKALRVLLITLAICGLRSVGLCQTTGSAPRPNPVLRVMYFSFLSDTFGPVSYDDAKNYPKTFVGRIGPLDYGGLQFMMTDFTTETKFDARENVRLIIEVDGKLSYVVDTNGNVWTPTRQFQLSPRGFVALYQFAEDLFNEKPPMKSARPKPQPKRKEAKGASAR